MEDPEKNKMEWVEIIEPRTKEHMYANLTTGECVWDPPPGVLVKRTTDSQWWELFDHKTSRFYYYNAATQRTVWHRPLNCDIIPLAKLQTLKQNTQVKTPGQESPSRGAEASSLLMPAGSAGTNSSTLSSTDSRPSVKKESVATQTPSRSALSRPERNGSSSSSSRRRSEDKAVTVPESRQPPSTNTASTSPLASPRPHRKHHHHHHHHHNCAKQKETNPVEDNPQRKSTASGGNQAWYSRHGKSQDSGRSSDSSTLSLSKRSLDNKTQMRTLLDPVPIEFGIPGSTASTGRNKGGLELSRQRSLDSETTSGVLPTQSRTPTPVRSGAVSKPNDLFYRDGSLSRSLSFMHQQRRPQTARGQGPLFDLWSPQREHLLGGDGSSAPGLDSLCTPMINRKQRSLESSASMSSKPSRSQQLLESLKSSTNNHRRPLGSSASFRCTTSTNNPLTFGSDSSPSPKREDSLKHAKDSLSRIRSGESSPHDSGLATTGSRASQDSNIPKKMDQLEASGGMQNYDSVPLYSNIDYNYYLDPKAQAHLLPLQQYILEQAKLSGYRFGDSSSPLVDDEKEKFHSDEDDDDDAGRRRRANRLQVHRHADQNDDSDDFADDEGMSNVEDSSSLEYLDESQYLEEDDHYTQFLLPPVPPQRHQSKSMIHPLPLNSHPLMHHQRRSPAAAAAAAPEVIVEPEYTEADPGFIHHHRSVVDGPSKSIMPSGSSSSLRPRPKEPIMTQSSSLYSPVLERAGSFAAMDGFRKTTLEAPSSTSIQSASLQRSPSSVCSKTATTPTDGDIEKYAQSNLNIHKKGLFRKNLSIRDMLSWSKDPIRKPMLPLEDKLLKKEACDLFKLVQVYMGDRKCKPGMTCNSVALELCNHAWNKPALRDELYLHICRQTTENPRKESLRRGWELMAVCLYFFPPSPKLEPYLDGYINRHRDPGLNFTEVDKWPIHVQVSHYATISCRRLLRIGASGRRNERKPTLEEIEQARLQIFRPSMFGNTLDEIMTVQRDRFPHRKLPWIQTTLSEEILRLQGAQTEGIFRVPADVDEVNSLKNRMDQWEVGQVSDAHVPASLLKLWYRELYESLIPDELYDDCVQYCSDPERAIAIVHRLPEFHRLVLAYLIRFLQIFAQTEVSSVTKMDASNLAMVMAPNCLRCNASDPKIIFDNARKEMAFIRTLIQHLDTSFMEGVV